MQYERTGVILCTERYEECVKFYERTLGLERLETLDNEDSKLTVFDFGCGNYLMIETGGEAISSGKSIKQNPVWLRFNVKDVAAASDELSSKGVEVTIRRETWGTVGDFFDPDGNVCSLREEPRGQPVY